MMTKFFLYSNGCNFTIEDYQTEVGGIETHWKGNKVERCVMKACLSNSRTKWPWMSLSSVNIAFKSGGETLGVCACPVSELITGISNFKHWKLVYFFLYWWRSCESKQARVPSKQKGYQWDYRNLRGVKAQYHTVYLWPEGHMYKQCVV